MLSDSRSSEERRVAPDVASCSWCVQLANSAHEIKTIEIAKKCANSRTGENSFRMEKSKDAGTCLQAYIFRS